MTAQHPKKQAFHSRGVVFFQFCSITNKYAKLSQNGPQMTPNPTKFVPEAPQKQCEKQP